MSPAVNFPLLASLPPHPVSPLRVQFTIPLFSCHICVAFPSRSSLPNALCSVLAFHEETLHLFSLEVLFFPTFHSDFSLKFFLVSSKSLTICISAGHPTTLRKQHQIGPPFPPLLPLPLSVCMWGHCGRFFVAQLAFQGSDG